MKKIIPIILFLSFINLYSQIPQTISWQGIIQDSEGNLLNEEVNLTLKLFEADTGGTAVWTELHQNHSINNGLANIILGSVTPLQLDFDKQYWLEITVGESTPMARMKLNAVPYSLYSARTSGIIVNDSIVLKDSLGVTRMVFNPNTGTFKMMDNDTVWYEVAVNSPSVQREVKDDGSVIITEGNKKTLYNPDGGKVWTETSVRSYDPYNYGTKHTKEYYESDGVSVYQKDEYQSNSAFEEKNNTVISTFYQQGAEVNRKETIHMYGATVEKTFKDGVITHKKWTNFNVPDFLEETFYVNGQIAFTKNTEFEPSHNGEFLGESVPGRGYIHTYRDYDSSGNIVSEEKVLEKFGGGTETISVRTKKNTTLTKDENGGFGQQNTKDGTSFFYQSGGQRTPSLNINQASGGPGFGMQIGMTDGETQGGAIALNTSGAVNLIPQNGAYVTTNGNHTVTGVHSVGSNQSVYGNQLVQGTQNVGGDLNVAGTKNFRIDHPENPENKYLVHAAIESNEVLNMYSGNVTTDNNGKAIVKLPQYFELINIDFRYQLTVIGEFAQAIVSKKIENNTFEIKTDKPNIEVSWQVTAKRNDKYLREHPFFDVRDK